MSKKPSGYQKKVLTVLLVSFGFGGLLAQFSPMKSGGFSSWFDDSYVKASAESSKTKEPAPVKIEKKVKPLSYGQQVNQEIEKKQYNGHLDLPLELQTDAKWKDTAYGFGNVDKPNTIEINGCAIVSLAMVGSYMDHQEVTPLDVLAWAKNDFFMEGSGRADMTDFARLAMFWLAEDCDVSNNFCQGTDHAQDGDVDLYDLDILTYSWLKAGGALSGTGIAPTVSIASPSNGRVFASGSAITIEANASDADGSIVRVEFYEGDNYLGEDLSSPYGFTWTGAASLPEGEYVLKAVAFDDDGLSTTSGPVTIQIEEQVIPTELVTNGGFETGDTTGWTPNLIGPSSTATASADSSHTGTYSAKLVTNWQGGTGVKSEINQMVTGLAGSTACTFEVWVKGQMGTGGVAWAEIKWYNAGGGQVGGTGLISLASGLSNTTFAKKGGTYTTPSTAVSGLISIRVEGGALAALNTMYVDDVYLSQ